MAQAKYFSVTIANKKIDDWVLRYCPALTPTDRTYYHKSIEQLYPVAVEVKKALLRQYQHGKVDYPLIDRLDENWDDLKKFHQQVYYGICALNKILPF